MTVSGLVKILLDMPGDAPVSVDVSYLVCDSLFERDNRDDSELCEIEDNAVYYNSDEKSVCIDVDLEVDF